MTSLEMLPAAGSPALTLMAWLMTYAVHSTLLGAGVWMATALLRGHALREMLWKAALIGGLLTTTLQVGLGVEPLGGRLVLPAPAGVVETTLPEAAGFASGLPEMDASRLAAHAEDRNSIMGQAETSATGAAASSQPKRLTATEIALLKDAPGIYFPSLSWGHLLLLAWAAGATLALVRMLRGRARFMAGLGERRSVTSPGLLASLARLRHKAGVLRRIRLTRSARLTSPVALGRDEICVPDRALRELNRNQQESMLAHELAHLARRDPVWLIISGVIESLFFFQPLNRLSRTHLQESSEFLCDEWAVRHTGRRRTLAHCLAHVASWLERTPHPAALAPMARLGSPLLRRIQHLLQSKPGTAPAGAPRLRAVAAMLPLAVVATLAPAISGDGPPPAPVAPQAPVVPTAEAAPTPPAPPAAPPARIASEFAAAPSPPAAPAWAVASAVPAAPAARDDEGEDEPSFNGTSRWIHEDDGNRFSMEVRGEIHFTAGMSDISSMTPGTSLRLEEEKDGTRRRLRITADEDGLPAYDYRVDGREVPFEPQGREFLATGLDQIRRQQQEGRERRAEAREERALRAVEWDEQRRQRDEMRRQQRDTAREMSRGSQALRRDYARQQEQMHRQERDRAMAYRDAARQLQMEQHQEQMEQRRQAMDLQRDYQDQAREAVQEAREMQRRAATTDPDEREATMEEARAAMRRAEEQVARIEEEMARRQLEFQQQHEESSNRQQQELEELQREMEESRARDMEENEQLMYEYQQRHQELEQEMMREMEEMEQLEAGEQPPAAAPLPPRAPEPEEEPAPPAAPEPDDRN